MTQNELLTAAGEVAPDSMQKVAAILDALGRTTPVFAQDMVREIDEVTTYTKEKIAASGPKGYGPLATFGAAVGGTVISGLVGSMATDLYDVARRGLTKNRNLKRIMEANPDLKKFDKKRLQESYGALHRYAPEFTADPMLGGTLLKAVAEIPGNEHTVIKDLISARKSLQEAKEKQFRPGHVTIDLPSEFDVARDAANQAHQTQMEMDRRGHTEKMWGLKVDVDEAKRKADEAFKNKQESEKRVHDLAKALQEAKNRRLDAAKQHERQAKIEQYKAKARVVGTMSQPDGSGDIEGIPLPRP